MVNLASHAHASAKTGETTETFARSLGCLNGVSGYMYHSVPVVLHAWFLNPRDYANAVTSIIRCGGDTDTTAAMLGAIVGSGVGRAGRHSPKMGRGSSRLASHYVLDGISCIKGITCSAKRRTRQGACTINFWTGSSQCRLFYSCTATRTAAFVSAVLGRPRTDLSLSVTKEVRIWKPASVTFPERTT